MNNSTPTTPIRGEGEPTTQLIGEVLDDWGYTNDMQDDVQAFKAWFLASPLCDGGDA